MAFARQGHLRTLRKTIHDFEKLPAKFGSLSRQLSQAIELLENVGGMQEDRSDMKVSYKPPPTSFGEPNTLGNPCAARAGGLP